VLAVEWQKVYARVTINQAKIRQLTYLATFIQRAASIESWKLHRGSEEMRCTTAGAVGALLAQT
jgi:hypothetical protein